MGGHKLSRNRRCELLGVARSTAYYKPHPVSPGDMELMYEIDKLHLARPYLGSRRIRDELRDLRHKVSRKKVQRLMRLMGIIALYPKPRTSIANRAHKVFPYLLRNLEITRANQVWCTDITYIPMEKGFLYCVAIMDWYSRKILSWRLSNTMDTSFCVSALEEALNKYGAPDIFNTDQGSQFTSREFREALEGKKIQISMDGKGRWMDNVFIERLWRSLKYEEVYLHAYGTMGEAKTGIQNWMQYYNTHRRHQGLDNQRPDDVYYDSINAGLKRSA
jgi:putative transposase